MAQQIDETTRKGAAPVVSGGGGRGPGAGAAGPRSDCITRVAEPQGPSPAAKPAFDPVAWQARYEAVLAELPPALGAQLKGQAAAALKGALRADLDRPLSILTAHEIMTTEWPPPIWAIPDLLPTGLCVFAGRPKLGKSWLALQIALAVAVGGVVLGRKLEPGPVLVLALEDGPARLQDRMRKQRWPADAPVDFLTAQRFSDEIGCLTREGGGQKLAAQIEGKHYRLVVIDTLSKAVAGDQNDVAAMTEALSPLQQLAHESNCCIMLIDHHNKVGALTPDVVSNILGSTAKGASPDTIWGLYRDRGKPGAKLAITGRDVEERTLALTMAWDLGCWQYDGDAEDIALTERRQEIIAALHDLGGKAKLKTICETISQDRGNTYRRLQDLVNAGQVKNEGGWYSVI